MTASVRKGDYCTGHLPCFIPRANDSGSSNVNVNGIPVHREGDTWVKHNCTAQGVGHPGTAAGGSSNVFANGKARCRVGDPVSCGSTMAEGSSNVFVNGK